MSRRPTVLISTEHWCILLSEAIRHFPLETGGIILGRWRVDGIAEISDVIGPGPCADHGKSSFDPDQEWQEQQVAQAWTRRSGLVEYLGDWHTHPDGSTRPSRRDHVTAITIASSPDARAPKPIILIVGASHNGSLRLTAQVLIRQRLKTVKVRIRPAGLSTLKYRTG